MKLNETTAIELLELITNDITTRDQQNLLINDYESWVLKLSKEELKGVIIGCAKFRLSNGNSRTFSKSKQEKETAKFKVSVANNFIKYANSIFLIK